jgi:outer membrane protein assembly factor BamB
MKPRINTKQLLTACLLASLCSLTAAAQTRPSFTRTRSGPSSDWLQWGGQGRDFVAPATELPSSWPAGGPRKLWSRALGDGLSGIAVEGTRLYTAYRRGSKEVVTALDTRTGKTLWVYAYDSLFKNFTNGVGDGPHAMPQVIGDRLVTASALGQIHSLNKKTGKVVWSRHLLNEFGATFLEHGYACHALPYKDSLIFLAGEHGSAAVALKQSDGAVLWKNMDFKNAYSSPLLIEVDGQPQVVALMKFQVIGFSPDNGQLLWQHPTTPSMV